MSPFEKNHTAIASIPQRFPDSSSRLKPLDGLPIPHPASVSQLETLNALPLPQPPSVPKRKTRRIGKIARLPKLHRDMVSRMMYDGVPYIRIRAALAELEIYVTIRNISNWKVCGGYDEWRAEQQHVFEDRLEQDVLLDHLRTDEPGQLPEVGLQTAATRVSQWLVHPDSRQEFIQNPQKFIPVISMLCRLNRELLSLQKYRDCYKAIHRRNDFEETANEVDGIRETFSGDRPPENPQACPPPVSFTTAELWPKLFPKTEAKKPTPG